MTSNENMVQKNWGSLSECPACNGMMSYGTCLYCGYAYEAPAPASTNGKIEAEDILIVQVTTPTQTVYIADCVSWGTDVMPSLWTENFEAAKRLNRETAEALIEDINPPDAWNIDVVSMDTGGTMVLSKSQQAVARVIGHWDGVE